ncbi:MAG: endoglycosylceramidase [Myxococcota bacterium]|jgi:endoglycosylceramidase
MIVLLLACSTDRCDIDPPRSELVAIEGTHLVDEHGRRVILRGVNAGGRSKMPPYMPFDITGDHAAALDDYLDATEGWGINVLRVPFSWAAMEPVAGADDEVWLAQYDLLLDAAWDRGLWTIVDFHQDLYAERYCGDGFPDWTTAEDTPGVPRSDCETWFTGYLTDDESWSSWDAFWSDSSGAQTAFYAMWERMAARHADRAGVIGFEIINEPFWGNADREEWSSTTLPGVLTETTARINAAAPDRLVLFGHPGTEGGFASTRISPPVGDGLVFAPHYYDPGLFLGVSLPTAPVSERLALWAEQGEAWEMPVLLGEFGIQADHPDAEDYLRDHFDALDDLQIHATAWEYSVSTDLWNFEDFSLVEADGTERDVLLDPMVRSWPRAIAGEDIAWGAGVLTYTAWPDGVTELVVPQRLGEVEVTVEGACMDERPGVVYLYSAEGGPVTVRVGG